MVGATSEQAWYKEMRTIKEPNFVYGDNFAGWENFLSKITTYALLFLAIFILPIGYFIYNVYLLLTLDFVGFTASLESQTTTFLNNLW